MQHFVNAQNQADPNFRVKSRGGGGGGRRKPDSVRPALPRWPPLRHPLVGQAANNVCQSCLHSGCCSELRDLRFFSASGGLLTELGHRNIWAQGALVGVGEGGNMGQAATWGKRPRISPERELGVWGSGDVRSQVTPVAGGPHGHES